ncbi:MAG: hypothetical protein JRN39_02815 [Nitrososphaerota archaeon]|nr:hypothetical protein [Nitrososphaerota archaeon]MDG6939313.1 hypothetical protein [Nitrososphaerota archaeon]
MTEKPWMKQEKGEPVPFFDQDVWCPKCEKETKHRLASPGYETPSPYFGGRFFMPAVLECQACKVKHT